MTTAPRLHRYFIRTEIQRLLLRSMSFCFLLLLARMTYTDSSKFAFLVWNLFLAFVPFCISQQLYKKPNWLAAKWKQVITWLVWLVFIPNTFYVITDLFHLYDSAAVPQWYDLLLIFSFAWNALLLGIVSVRQMEKLATAIIPSRLDYAFIYPLMFLNALGVYIGRFLRYNSWDVISNPFDLMGDMLRMLLHPLHYKAAWGMIMTYSIFLSLLYFTVKKLSRAIQD